MVDRTAFWQRLLNANARISAGLVLDGIAEIAILSTQ